MCANKYRLLSSTLVIVLILFILAGCKFNNIEAGEQQDLDIKELYYSIMDGENVIGSHTFKFEKEKDGKLKIIEKKEYDAEFLVGIKEDVSNIRKYVIIMPDFKLINYNENEYIEDKNRLTIQQELVEHEGFNELNTEIIELNTKNEDNSHELSVKYPKGSNIYSNSMKYMMYMFNSSNLILDEKEYHFYYNSEGYIEHSYIEDSETLTTVNGVRETYRILISSSNNKYIWVDKESNIVLRIQETIGENKKITTVLEKIE